MRAELGNTNMLRLAHNGGTVRPAVARGPAGPNTVPTDEAIAAAIANEASDTAAALAASYAAFTDEAGEPIPDKRARIIFDSTGFPVDIVLEDA